MIIKLEEKIEKKKIRKDRNVRVLNFKDVKVRFLTFRTDVYSRKNYEGPNDNNL